MIQNFANYGVINTDRPGRVMMTDEALGGGGSLLECNIIMFSQYHILFNTCFHFLAKWKFFVLNKST